MRNLIEIKPCPFCGRGVKFRYFPGDLGYEPVGFECTFCNAEIVLMNAYGLSTDKARAIAAKKWNRRAGDNEAD